LIAVLETFTAIWSREKLLGFSDGRAGGLANFSLFQAQRSG